MRNALTAYVPLLIAALVAASCGSSGGGTTQPSPMPGASAQTANIAGAWSGGAVDSSGRGSMSWQITQTDASFSGTVTMTDNASGLAGRGSVSGTVSGTAVRFSISMPAGGFQSPYASCTASVTGEGQATSSAITGTYTGSSSCGGPISAGQLALEKQ